MGRYPTVSLPRTSRLSTDVFRGYNHKLKISASEFYDMENLSSTHYPMLANRRARGKVAELSAPGGMLAKGELAYVDGGTLFFAGEPTPVTGLSEGEKQLVSMGAYICIFPDKVYYNTADPEDRGSMEASYSFTGAVRYHMCDSEGNELPDPVKADEEPESPANSQLWLDTSGGEGVLMQYSAAQAIWTAVTSVYTKVTFETMGELPKLFAVYDGVSISGADNEELNGSKIIYGVGGKAETEQDYIVLTGLTEKESTVETAEFTIKRTVPDMDFICQCQNRLWGCFYGSDGAKTLNEIYCSALGDFKNWGQFMGLSTDSWRGSVGSDGEFTGAINYLGYPCFFKENCLHRVSVSSVGAHSITETICRGVQKGSHKSLVTVDETLYYKSRSDICAYQGGFPQGISAALGDEKYYEAAAGAFGGRYYISMRDRAGAWNLFVYDINRGLWHREDSLHALAFAAVDDELYTIDAKERELLAVNGTVGEPEEAVRWRAETGIQLYEYPDRKYISRFNIKLQMGEGSRIDIFIEYDSNEWTFAGRIEGIGTNTATIPVRPRRCDHLRIKLEGEGDAKIFSITRILELGSDMR